MSVGISPIDHAMPPPVYWSTSGGSPHVRPMAPNHSATKRPDAIMIAIPKNACMAMIPMRVTRRNGYGSRYGTGSMPTSDCTKR